MRNVLWSLVFSACTSGTTPLLDTDPTVPDTDVAAAEVLPLHLAFTYHLEGAQLVATRAAFDRYTDGIRGISQLFHAHGAIPTWDAAEIVGASIDYDVNVLLELQESGDTIGLHANGVGYVGSDPDYTTDEMIAELQRQKDRVDSLGVDVRHVSNICSEANWVEAVREVGFDAATAMVDFCLLSLPEPPSEVADCPSPAQCHDAYPGTIEGQMSPWYAEDGSNWTTPAASGLLLVPTSGSVDCASEAAAGEVSPTHCSFDAGDAEAVLAEIDATLAARQPGVQHTFVMVDSFGQVPDEAVMTALLAGIDERYVATGEAGWVGFHALIEDAR